MERWSWRGLRGPGADQSLTLSGSAADYTHSISADDLTNMGTSFAAIGALLTSGTARLEFSRLSNVGDTSYHYGVTVYKASIDVTYTTAPYTIAPFCENFEGGTDGAVVTTSNTGFWAAGSGSIHFTNSSYTGHGGALAVTGDGSEQLTVYPNNRTSGLFNSTVVVEGKLRIASGGSPGNTIYLMSTSVIDPTDFTNSCFSCGPALFLATDGSLGGGNNVRLTWSTGTMSPLAPVTNHADFALSYDTWYHVILTWRDADATFDLVVKSGDDTSTAYSNLGLSCLTGSQYYDSDFMFAWNGSTTTWDEIGVNCASFLPPSANNANCGTKVARYTVSPNGPNDVKHRGQFAVGSARTVSFMASLGSDGGQDFYVQPIARFLAWNGVTFSLLSNSSMGSPVHLTGDASWTTITRIMDAPSGATHWGLDFAVASAAIGTAPTIGTILYLDCVYVVEDGRDLSAEPYLDGDQVGTIRGDGHWEGTPHDSTSIWGVPAPPDPTDPPPTDPGGDTGGGDAPTDPTVDTPPDSQPVPPAEQVIVTCPAADLVTRRHPNNSFCPDCLDGDIQLGDHLFNTVDEFGTLWSISDIEGWWNLPDPDIPDITRGIDDGSYQTRGRYSARIFTVNGSFWPPSPGDMRAARDRLIRAANLCHYGAWFATHEPDATRASIVWLSGRPSIDTVSNSGRTDFSLGLKAPDPIKYGLKDRLLPGWNNVALKSSSSTADFGRVYDRLYQWSYPNVPSGGVLADTATVNNDGNVRVSPIITVFGPTIGPIDIMNTTTNQVTRVRLALAADDALMIDCQNRTVSLNGVPNKRLYLDTITDWIYLDPGANTFKYTEESGSSSSFITVQWRSGWIG
jgi:hypothetical protein